MGVCENVWDCRACWDNTRGAKLHGIWEQSLQQPVLDFYIGDLAKALRDAKRSKQYSQWKAQVSSRLLPFSYLTMYPKMPVPLSLANKEHLPCFLLPITWWVRLPKSTQQQ